MPARPRGWAWARGAAILIYLLGPPPAQAQQMDDEVLTRVRAGRVWTAPKSFGAGGVLALTFLGTPRDRLAVIVEGPRKTGELPTRVLSFYLRKGAGFSEWYRFTTPNFFVAMYPNMDGDRLITTWSAGSGQRTVIFSFTRDGVRGVLWLGWKRPPEFVDLDGDGEQEVIQAREAPPGSLPGEAEIYRWTGREYQLIRRVPWAARYQAK